MRQSAKIALWLLLFLTGNMYIFTWKFKTGFTENLKLINGNLILSDHMKYAMYSDVNWQIAR